jgi:type II secretory pathway component PulK
MNKKQAKLEYKLSHRQMGVFQIRNFVNDKIFIASSVDVPGFINRTRFQLNADAHPSLSLQRDWSEFGEENFAFEILEEVAPREQPDYNYRADVDFLEDLWLEKEQPYGDKGYNQKKKTRDERLQMIAGNRKK